MLRESYISNWKNLPKDAKKIRVAIPSILAPSKNLLDEFNQKKKELRRMGFDDITAHNKAFVDVDYERRFREEVLSRPEALSRIREIRELARQRDVYLICYEKPPKKCHRFILIEMAEKEMNETNEPVKSPE